jgi:RNA polymerase primary sigma factor
MNPALIEEKMMILDETDELPEEEFSEPFPSEEGEPAPASYTLQQYMREVNSLPLLRHEETVELFKSLEEKTEALTRLDPGDPEFSSRRMRLERELSQLKERIITTNLRLVVFLANRYQGRGLSIQDLVQEGNIGLIRAVEKFDYRMGYRFSTYATWWIRQAMLRAIQQSGRLIRIPTHMLEKYQQHMRSTEKEPSTPEGGDQWEEAIDSAEDSEMVILREVMREPLSLDAPMTDDGLDLQEVTKDENQPLPDESLIREDLWKRIREGMRTLPLREEVILRLRYGIDLDNSHTLEEVGRLFGLTKERIRQIEARALRKLGSMAN